MKFRTPLFLIILLSFSIPPMALGDWYESDYVYFEASPETVTSSGWVTFTLLSKQYSGDCDLAWGFDSAEIQPSTPEIWANYSHTLWEWGSELDENGTIIPVKEYYTKWFYDWKPLEISPTKLSFQHRGMDRWYLYKSVPITAGKVYKVRAWMDVAFPGLGKISGKYFFGMKRSIDTIQEAISTVRFFLLDPWYDSTWSHRLKITFDNSASTENLTDFPVMIKLDSTNFDFSLSPSDGDDLYPTDSDGNTSLAYEIEEYNYTTENAVLWIKVPQIDANSTTDHIWLYYGNQEASTSEDPEAVWDSNYLSVQHLEDLTNSTTQDSTKYDNDGMKIGVNEPLETTGYIAEAQYFDGTNDRITLPDSPELETVKTASFIIYPNVVDGLDNIIRSTGTFGGLFLKGSKLEWYNNPTWFGLYDISVDDWYFCDWLLNGTHGMLYVNGSIENTIEETTTWDLSIANIGNDAWGNALIGKLDEIRLLNTTRSSDWIYADYLSMTNGFISYGEPELCDYTLTLQILNSETPIENATISIVGSGGEYYDVSDSEGRISITAPYGEYLVTISAQGHHTASFSLFLEEDHDGPFTLLQIEEGVMIENNIPLMMLSLIPVGLSIQYFRKKELLWAGSSAFMWLIAGAATIQADPSNWIALRAYTLFFMVMIIFTLYTALRWLQESINPRDDYWDDL